MGETAFRRPLEDSAVAGRNILLREYAHRKETERKEGEGERRGEKREKVVAIEKTDSGEDLSCDKRCCYDTQLLDEFE
jgi:hypothetical protein